MLEVPRPEEDARQLRNLLLRVLERFDGICRALGVVGAVAHGNLRRAVLNGAQHAVLLVLDAIRYVHKLVRWNTSAPAEFHQPARDTHLRARLPKSLVV